MARTCIAVAMSGGVDSSVAAALLQRAGHDVIGLTLRLHVPGPDGAVHACGGDSAESAAAAVAARMGVPHQVIDLAPQFLAAVLRPAWDEYAAGRTPNPCVACNQAIKFGLLLDRARVLGAVALATGHYARVAPGPDGAPALFRGRDPAKDQSYFLHRIHPERLAAIRFPLGDLTKPEVRALAAEWGFENARRPDSQDACLAIGDLGFPETLRRLFGQAANPGPVVDESGRMLGTHAGVHGLTVGQRRGVGPALGRRAWVLRLDGDRAVVTTDPDRLACTRFRVRPAPGHGRWLPDGARADCAVQVRYRHVAVPCRVTAGDGAWQVDAATPIRAVTPGQSAVFYEGDRVLGGGVILAAEPAGGVSAS